MFGFSDDYEVCSCKKVNLGKIIDCIQNQNAKTLRDIQESTGAGTDCRYCVFPEGDEGKIKKKIYCKDILQQLKGG